MNRFDEALNSIRHDEPSPETVANATENVRQKLFGPGAAGVERLRGCEDFQSLIPAYQARTLSDARRMLLEDHLHTCVACRRAAEERASGPRQHVVPLPASKPSTATRRLAIAAALLAGIGLTSFAAYRTMFVRYGPVAEIQSVDGMLLQVADTGGLPIGQGRQVMDGEAILTARGGTAVVRLFDGSLVEMNERTELSIDRGWRDTTIRLHNGQVIVEAARQKIGRLRVATGDSLVSVKGTIFSVNRGLKGTRVAVVEGAVEVQTGARTALLDPGQQTSSNPALSDATVYDEVEWSRNAARYLALLGEFHVLQKKLESIPEGSLRYTTKLLDYMPAGTLIYGAMPNAGKALAQAKQVFDEQAATSEVLKEWWTGHDSNFDTFIAKLVDLSASVGDEVVFFIDRTGPAILTEVRGSGIEAQISSLLAGQNDAPAYAIRNGILILGHPDRVRQMQAIVAAGPAPGSPFRDRIAQAYPAGVEWLLAANVEQILGDSVNDDMPVELGIKDARYVIADRREIGTRVENRVKVSFKGARTGLPGWIATPGPLSTLEFVTPQAGAAVSISTQNPRQVVEELFAAIRRRSPTFDQDLATAEQKLGISILDDLAAPLGSEGTFAIDGALFPVPGWKLVVEVYSPQRLQSAIAKLINAVNAEQPGFASLTQETVNGRAWYTVTWKEIPFPLHYTFTDTYMVAGGSRTLVEQAIQTRATGVSLARAEAFRSELPSGPSANYSAVVYQNLSGLLTPVIDTVKDANVVTPAQRQAMLAVKESKPGVIAMQADTDSISVAALGKFLGFNLGSLLSLHDLPGLMYSGVQTQ